MASFAPWLVVLAGVFGAGRAHATDIAIKLSGTGSSVVGQQTFDDAVHRALAGTRYSVVTADKAAYALEVDVKQTGADYNFKLRLVEKKSSRVVVDHDGRCTGCDDVEAANRLRLATESVLVAGLETPVLAAPSASASASSSGALPSTPGESPRTSAWVRALPWVGLLGVAGASAAVHAHYRCRQSAGEADGCTVPLVGLASLGVLSAGLAVGTSLSLAVRDPSTSEGSELRWAPWVILVSGVAAGVSGAGILAEHGYGHDGIKALGFASIGAGAAVAVAAVGAIIKAPDSAGRLAFSISPSSVGLSARF
ncbi:MAG TPA: hypothetical protein VNO55_26945 [Polyangia bacterium]|nr:hypothetical protein [Polyangia bacterium]